MTTSKLSRRHFLFASSALALSTGCMSNQKNYSVRKTTLAKSGFQSPNEKLNIAGIGAGGKGNSDIMQCSHENIVAICDVDSNNAKNIFNRFPTVPKFNDYRKMLDEIKEIDAVIVSTPDHHHAPAALRAMAMGKHVYVQKPLTHTVHEARLMRQAANQYGVATQMGNNGAASDFQREVIEIYQDGIVGQVTEVHSWTNRPTGWWPQGVDHVLPKQPIPDHLDWELWQGPAPRREYNAGYCPFKWRGWWDYGTGALGDIACHNLSPIKKALQLGFPDSVECIHLKGDNPFSYPLESIIKYQFPQRGELSPVDLYWYDGKLKPQMPFGWEDPHDEILGESNGVMLVGETGLIVMQRQADVNIVVKDQKILKDYTPPRMVPRLPHIAKRNNPEQQDEDQMHKIDWILSCKTGSETGSDFNHAGVLTEFVLLGNIALRYPNQKLLWDGENLRFTNHKEANQWITKDYHQGWELVL